MKLLVRYLLSHLLQHVSQVKGVQTSSLGFGNFLKHLLVLLHFLVVEIHLHAPHVFMNVQSHTSVEKCSGFFDLGLKIKKTYNFGDQCMRIIQEKRTRGREQLISTPLGIEPLHSKLGCLLSPSSNSSATLHGGGGGGKALFSPF